MHMQMKAIYGGGDDWVGREHKEFYDVIEVIVIGMVE